MTATTTEQLLLDPTAKPPPSFPLMTAGFTWSVPTVSGQVCGYTLGIRLDGTSAGTYGVTVPITGVHTAAITIAQLFASNPLPAGNYWAALRCEAPSSPWSAPEVPFSVAATPVPTGLAVS